MAGLYCGPLTRQRRRHLDPGRTERQLKERIVGATVIVALGIIVIPWLLDGPAQSSRPVEQVLELPLPEQPGRTYTIPLDPGAGPPVQIDSGSDVQPLPSRPGSGTVQRPAREEEPAATIAQPQPQPQAPPKPQEQPEQPPPRPATQPTTQATAQPAPRTAPQATPAVDGPYTVQVGSFSQAENAQALQRRLAGEGFEAFVSRVATDAGTMHRVRVGPVPERSAADSLLARLRAAGHSGARVVRAED